VGPQVACGFAGPGRTWGRSGTNLSRVCSIMAVVCNKFDDEMEQLAAETKAGRTRETA
jgi:hypothetical protein